MFTSVSASSFDQAAIHGWDLVLPKSLFPTAEMIAVEVPILADHHAELQNMSGFLKISLFCHLFPALDFKLITVSAGTGQRWI